jgi:hypothetical protein
MLIPKRFSIAAQGRPLRRAGEVEEEVAALLQEI